MQGIYQIRNIENNKVYIGSSIDIEFRWKTHQNELNKNKHVNSRLQNDWDEYGEDCFVFEVLEITEESPREEIFILEQKYIDKYQPHLNGYNMTDIVTGIPKYNKLIKPLINYTKETPLRSIGNSLGVIIPSDMLKEIGVKKGDQVSISFENGEIIIRNTEQKKIDEDDLRQKILSVIEEYIEEHGRAW